jgi:hypothetical protein
LESSSWLFEEAVSIWAGSMALSTMVAVVIAVVVVVVVAVVCQRSGTREKRDVVAPRAPRMMKGKHSGKEMKTCSAFYLQCSASISSSSVANIAHAWCC